MKVIIVPVSDRPECVIALHQGFTLGKKIGASLIGYHMRPHRHSDISLPSDTDGAIVNVDSYDMAWEAALSESSKEDDHVKAHLLFEKMAQQFNYDLARKAKTSPCAVWAEKVGSPAHLFSIMGPVSDLIMVSRPARKGQSKAKTIMQCAVMNSSTPVLVLPQKELASLGKRICLAWNQSTEAMLAIKAATPLLREAEEVNIITCGIENRLGPKSNHLKKYLDYWHVKTNHISASGNSDTDAILSGYRQTESDLLVMGGYSRGRLRQLVFGGVTEYMLNEAQIPVFILHV